MGLEAAALPEAVGVPVLQVSGYLALGVAGGRAGWVPDGCLVGMVAADTFVARSSEDPGRHQVSWRG